MLVLCDPRIRSRPYGELFITSLPPMPITRELQEVSEFFRSERQSWRDGIDDVDVDTDGEEVAADDSVGA